MFCLNHADSKCSFCIWLYDFTLSVMIKNEKSGKRLKQKDALSFWNIQELQNGKVDIEIYNIVAIFLICEFQIKMSENSPLENALYNYMF